MNLRAQQKRPALHEVLAYDNEYVIGSFLKSFNVPEIEARDIFEQLKRMLWLTNEMDFDGLHEQGKIFSIDRSLLILDEMWHSFILCTRDYQKFCTETFGYYIHHHPQVESEDDKLHRRAQLAGLNDDQLRAQIADEKRWQYTYVFKKLGKETFIKWYTEFHEKYTPHRLLDLRRQKLHPDVRHAA